MKRALLFVVAGAVVLTQWSGMVEGIPLPVTVTAQCVVLTAVLFLTDSFGAWRWQALPWGAGTGALAFVMAGLVYAAQSAVGLAADPGSFRDDGLPWTIAYALILTPLLEEWLFRGLIQDALRNRFGRRRAMFGQAALFGGFHLAIAQLLPTFVLGVLTGWLRQRTGTLWAGVVAHAVLNAAGLTLFVLIPGGERTG